MSNVLNVSIFSLMLGQDTDIHRLKGALQNEAESCKNIYLQDEAYIKNNCVYYLEYSSGKRMLHIAARHNKYPDIRALQKRDSMIASITPKNITFAKIAVLWPQWEKVPAMVLAKHLNFS